MDSLVETIRRETLDLSAEGLLAHVLRQFGHKVALASSTGAEDQVLTDMLCKLSGRPRVFTLDTGRLPQETYDVIEAMHGKYGLRVRILLPEASDVEPMVNQRGPNLFRQSVEDRRRCCHVRKVLPLQRELATLEAWVTGLRRGQSVTRQDIERVEWDGAHGLVKINPLANWTDQQVWDYIRRHEVPYNKLHDRGYPSIGCAPCTRAVAEGQDIRAGRWWWEQPELKECGLHIVNGRLTRSRS